MALEKYFYQIMAVLVIIMAFFLVKKYYETKKDNLSNEQKETIDYWKKCV